MLGEKKLKQIAEKILKISKANETEVLLFVSENGLTRFANSEIHQNMAWDDIAVSVRVIVGKNIGVASIGGRDVLDKPFALEQMVRQAEKLASFQKDDPHFVSLPKKEKIPVVKNEALRVSEKERAQAVHTIIKKAKAKKITASGAYNSVVSELAIANSHGVWTYHVSGASDLSTILLGATSTGFGSAVGRDSSEINAGKVADSAIAKIEKGANPQSVTKFDELESK
jgi:predicted Zn-dependent protease